MLAQRSMRIILICAALAAASAQPASAWGIKGHTMIGEAAVAHLPDDLPAYVRSESAKREIVYLQAEEDRLKIGEDDRIAWDREWSTDHYVDIADDGTIGGALSLSMLPATRDDFIAALYRSPHPVDAYAVGFLPYAILEGYEQVRADFALVRDAQRKNAADELPMREALAVHDIGIFSHFVGDGSEPLHVSVHYNGWGDYPNPDGFTKRRDTHAEFESDFVDKFVASADVTVLVGPVKELSATPLAQIEQYLAATDAQVVPFYRLEKLGAFLLDGADPQRHRDGVRFADVRLAAGAQMLVSLIDTAWRTSADLKAYVGASGRRETFVALLNGR